MQIRDGAEQKVRAQAFVDAVGPGAVGRCSWETEQTRRDLELLWWIGRFRFVTTEQIASKLECSAQRANARVRRLERRALVGRQRTHLSEPRAIFLAGRGHELLGLPRRRGPRAHIQREHEAAIVDLALALERQLEPPARVLTERQCRQHDRAHPDGHRYGVQVAGAGRGDRHRWPDLAIHTPHHRVAVELELTPKGTNRLRAIIAGYRASTYTDVIVAARGPALHARITKLAATGSGPELPRLLALHTCPITVLPWRPGAAGASTLARTLAAGLARQHHRSVRRYL